MLSPAKYITLLLLLLCSLQSRAQRTIEWYEPDFDSVYRQCFFVYGESFYIPHYYHFWSKTARKYRLKSTVTYSEHTGTMPYSGVQIAKYDTAGYLDALEWYAYNVHRGHKDTFTMWRQKISHEISSDGVKVVVDMSIRDHGDTSSHKYVFHFNDKHILESTGAPNSANYRYDNRGRLFKIEAQGVNRSDSLYYSPFVRGTDEDTDSSDQLMYRRMRGVWPENILSFILDSSNRHNRHRMMWESVTRIGDDTYPGKSGYEVLTASGLNFVKRVRFKDSDEEKGGFAQMENGRMVMYSRYSFLGKGFEYMIAQRAGQTWNVVEYILGNRERYELPATELPDRRRFPDHVDILEYTFH